MKKKAIIFLSIMYWIGTGVFAQKSVPMDGFFGVNVFRCQEPPEDVDDVSDWIRDYTHWTYFEPHNNEYHFTDVFLPKYKDTVNYDTYYKKLKSMDIQSLFVVMSSPKWASSRPDDKDYHEFAPSLDQSGMEPEHYREYSEFYYQLVSRYGSKKQPKNKLLTDDKLSGMDLVSVVEVENEPDGPPDWGDRITLEQYAAMLNAAYDGNNGELGEGYGVKAADPDMPVSIGGLGFNLKALKEITELAGRKPYDIINVHFYTFKHVRENYRVAIPPEWSSLESDMKEIAEWRDNNAPGKPVWLTEIGFDTEDYSTEYVTEQEAANYLIRSYLLALGAGVEKCFWFIFRDLDGGKNPHVFLSSGLFENDDTEWEGRTRLKPKMTYWYNATFKKLTQDYVFEGDFSLQEDSTVRQYNFAGVNESERLSIVWYCPKERKRWKPLPAPTEIDYTFEAPEGWQITRVLKPADGTIDGKEISTSSIQSGVEFPLNGTPVFIHMRKK